MHPKTKQRLLAVIGLLFFAGICIGTYFVIKYFIGLILSLDKQISATIIATSGTILTAVATLVFSQNLSKKREISEVHRPNKIKAYKFFMQMMIDILRRVKKDDKFLEDGKLPEDLQELFFELQSEMIVWGSPNVIKAYQTFRAQSVSGANVLLAVDNVLQEIRKDLGHSNKDLKRGDLIKLFLTDPEELDKLMS